jgi:hypothetical protein
VKYADNPIYSLEDKKGVYTVDVIRDGTDYVLFASSPNGDREYEVHAVRSPDGLTFDEKSRRIVLEPTRDRSWDHALVYGMEVVPRGESLYMWFNGIYTRDVSRGGEIGLARAKRSALAAHLGSLSP